MAKLVDIRFIKNYTPYNSGEVASYTEEQAKYYLDRKVAVLNKTPVEVVKPVVEEKSFDVEDWKEIPDLTTLKKSELVSIALSEGISTTGLNKDDIVTLLEQKRAVIPVDEEEELTY